MTTSKEQLADLRAGDLVDFRRDHWPSTAFVRGPLGQSDYDETLYILDGLYGVRQHNGSPYYIDSTVTLVERGLQPVYVNHSRTEPFSGDIVCDADAPSNHRLTYLFGDDDSYPWRECMINGEWLPRDELPKRLRLLIDGETGEVVP